MQLRRAEHHDVNSLRQLIATSARALSAGYYSPRQIETAITSVFGVDRQLIDDGTYFVAEIDGALVGCGGWSKRKTLFGGDQYAFREDSPLDPQVDPARIRAFFVHPQFARRGIGRAIVARCERAAREARFSRLDLVATLPGEPLYRACGYCVVDRIEIPLPDGSGLLAARMSRSIIAADGTILP